MRFRREAAAIVAITFLYISLPRLWRDLLWLLSSRISRKIFRGPAPLLCSVPQSRLIPNIYVVSLTSSYSLDQHKQTIGRADDLNRAIVDFDEIGGVAIFENAIYYEAKVDDSTLMTAIRSYYRVLFVECHGKPHLRGGVESHRRRSRCLR
jgi:hypothetical protein